MDARNGRPHVASTVTVVAAAAAAVVIRDLGNRSNLRQAVTIAVTDDADQSFRPPPVPSMSPKITLISIALCFRVAPLDPKFRSRRRRQMRETASGS